MRNPDILSNFLFITIHLFKKIWFIPAFNGNVCGVSQAKTNDPDISDKRQDEKQMTAEAYTTKGGSSNYLHIGIDAEELKVGDNMKINLNFDKSPGVQNQDFTYLVGTPTHTHT